MPLVLEATIVLGSFLFLFYSGYITLMFLQSKKAPPKKKSASVFAPSVSVIVPTYNEEKVIVSRLRNLLLQDYPILEILVVDSASLDRTTDLVDDFLKKNKTNIYLLKQDVRSGKAAALNQAFKLCSGEVVVITDADVLFERDTVRKLASNFVDGSIGGVCGRLVVSNVSQTGVTGLEKSYRSFFDIIRSGESVLGSTPIFNGPVMAFRREIIQDGLRIDSIADDTELSLGTIKKGYASKYDPEAIAHERTPVTFRSRVTQKIRRGQGIIQSFIQHRDMLFRSRYGKFGSVVFPAEFFMHIISPVLVFTFVCLVSTTFFGLAQHMPVCQFAFLLLSVSLVLIFAVLAYRRISCLSFVLNFLSLQLVLLAALISHVLGRRPYKWEKIQEISYLQKTTT